MISSVSKVGILGVGSVVLIVGLGLFYSLMASGVLSDENANDQLTSCVIKDEAFLPVEAYGDFVKFIDGSGELASTRFDPGVSGESRRSGFFTALALEPRYLAENEANARSWGYEPLPDRPRLPLSGSIVLENPGLLEIYQEVSAFTTKEMAVGWMNRERGAPEELIAPAETRLIRADDVILRTNKPSGPEYETTLGVTMRVGNLGIGLGLQGGAEVTFDRMLPLVQDVLSRVRAACGR